MYVHVSASKSPMSCTVWGHATSGPIRTLFLWPQVDRPWFTIWVLRPSFHLFIIKKDFACRASSVCGSFDISKINVYSSEHTTISRCQGSSLISNGRGGGEKQDLPRTTTLSQDGTAPSPEISLRTLNRFCWQETIKRNSTDHLSKTSTAAERKGPASWEKYQLILVENVHWKAGRRCHCWGTLHAASVMTINIMTSNRMKYIYAIQALEFGS